LRKGVTLIELMVVIALVSVVAGVAIVSFSTTRKRASIERDVQRIYSEIQRQRMKAFTKKVNIKIFCDVIEKENGVKEYLLIMNCTDSNGNPCNSHNATPDNVTLENPFTGTLSINSKGLFSQLGSIRYNGADSVSPKYDCVVASPYRIRMGRWDKDEGKCR